MDVRSGRMEGGGLRESCFAEAPAMRGHEGCQTREGRDRRNQDRGAMSRVTSSESAIESVSRPFNLRRPRPSCLSLPPSSRASFRCMRRRRRRRRRRPRFGPPTHAHSPPKQTEGRQAGRLAGRLAEKPSVVRHGKSGRDVSFGRTSERSIHPSPPRPLHRHLPPPSLRPSPRLPSSSFFDGAMHCHLALGGPTTETSSKKMRQGAFLSSALGIGIPSSDTCSKSYSDMKFGGNAWRGAVRHYFRAFQRPNGLNGPGAQRGLRRQ